MSEELSPEEFRRGLLRMKHEGCSILVSSRDDRCATRASRRTLGSVPSYSRVIVSGEDDNVLGDRLPAGVTADSDCVSVVDHRDVLTSATDAETGVDDLRTSVCDAVDSFDASNPGPGELRLSLDTVTEVAGEVGGDLTCDLTDAITDSVCDACGMAYYHVDADDEATRASLSESCDAEVEVRADGGVVYQRWHLPEAGSTGWLHL